jgi:hypothetical protein
MIKSEEVGLLVWQSRQNLSGELEGKWKGGDSLELAPFGLLTRRVK